MDTQPIEQKISLEPAASPRRFDEAEDPLNRAQMLPLRLVLEAPVINFTVDTLMNLEPGSVVETAAQHNEDLLLSVSGQVLGSAKFDVTRDKLAVRLTGVA